MTGPWARLRIGFTTLGIVFCAATLGYRLAGWNWLDSVYMVVTTVSTVGFREMGEMTPALKVFTIFVILFGVSTSFYILGGFVQMVLEGEVNRALGRRRVSREIERLSGHVVICGFGRMGEVVAAELHRRKDPFVLVERNPDHVAQSMSFGYLGLQADATEEESLIAARVADAKALVTTLPDDADNVFITLTARNLNPKLQIIARGEHRSTEKKLIQAGADRVILPATTGALRMVAMVTRPSTIELIELAAGGHIAEMALDEFAILPNSPLVGVAIRDAQPRSLHGILIVAIRHSDGQFELSPSATSCFGANDTVVVIGRIENIEAFRSQNNT